MVLIILIVVLCALRYFEVGFFAHMSWWWVAGVFAVAFLWFEFGEKMLGLDRRRAHESLEQAREDRVKRTFGKK
ncbi:MAG: hypothetical protein H6R01_631 [Burkholderiaceae bacterium]|nr:hypothetical protein [Burkholderiaceae bacterium]